MEGAGTLELLAELAIGVLGFSGIVAAIGQRGSGEWAPMDRGRFFFMVFSGALVIILALLPFPLHYAGLEVASLWSWSSGAGALLIFLYFIGVKRATPNAGVREMYRDPEASNVALGFGLLASFGSVLLLCLNAMGILFDRTFVPYLVAVLLIFVVSLVAFVRFLQAAVRRGGRAA